MWRKILGEVRYHQLTTIFVFLAVIFGTLGIFLYWQSNYLNVGYLLFSLLLGVIVIFGILFVVSTHVAHRDGFRDGYQNGYHDGQVDGGKKIS